MENTSTASGRIGACYAVRAAASMVESGPARGCKARVLVPGARSTRSRAGLCLGKVSCPLAPLPGHMTRATGTAPKAWHCWQHFVTGCMSHWCWLGASLP